MSALTAIETLSTGVPAATEAVSTDIRSQAPRISVAGGSRQAVGADLRGTRAAL